MFHGKDEVPRCPEIFPKNFKLLTIQFDKFFENGTNVVVLGSFKYLGLSTNKEVGSQSSRRPTTSAIYL
jgi:hypothetical protein